MEHYDIIIIGTGAGGGTLLHTLKDSGKKILVLERGTFLPREKENWDTIAVFQKERYHTTEVWKTESDKDLHPGTGYWVGGNTKVYGAALFRLREKDFEETQHAGGISPEWVVKYNDFEPFYAEAEKIYTVHGKSGIDPTEPPRSNDYPYPQVSNEPVIQELEEALVKEGHRPFPIPMGIQLNEQDMVNSPCVRCNTCDGFPCLLHAKADAEVNAVRPSLNNTNITLLTNAKAVQLITNATGTAVVAVKVEHENKLKEFTADIFVSSAGAVNSAVLLLRSATDKHPGGLANSSGQVGRNFMKHNNAAMMGVTLKKNPTIFQKTLAVSDYYFGDNDFKFPMGCVQLLGKSNKDMMKGDAPFFTPGIVLDEIAEHAVDWWLTGEDLPAANNRVQFLNGQVHLDYTENNLEGFKRLQHVWEEVLKKINGDHYFIPHSLYLRKQIPLQGVAHQCGTLRFGNDPKTSVLDPFCKAHELENLYVVDGSFFPSSGAVNPSLTIMANAIRVGKHLMENVLR
ncbi:MAG: GMC family oxidoreductase [Bacteroidetes bacterium]|nr:GMC family oxidoreductase [Bacteroidota bacterium]